MAAVMIVLDLSLSTDYPPSSGGSPMISQLVQSAVIEAVESAPRQFVALGICDVSRRPSAGVPTDSDPRSTE